MSEFERLRDARKEVAAFASAHRRSIEEFRAPEQAWFKLFPGEPMKDIAIRHKSTTASCLESLDDTTLSDDSARELIREIAPVFASNALKQGDNEWESEYAAWVYCRVRTLPAIIRFAPDVADAHAGRIAELVDYVWSTVTTESRRQAVYESPKLERDDPAEKQEPSYPPNAFHTFWALRTLHMCMDRPALEPAAAPHEEARRIAELWTQNMLASQIALQVAGSDRADPNQLAWSLIAQFVDPAEPTEPAASEFARRDLYRAALGSFFAQQLDNGTWPLGQPLFHYPRAGNAYCYTFETLTELLRPALYNRDGALMRELLLPHLDRLLRAFRYAEQSARPISPDGLARGWSSGHHPHRTDPEGWATAAVYSFAQSFRRLLARWTRDLAAVEVRARPPSPLSRDEALNALEERGNTWRAADGWSVGEQLAALFLHPIDAHGPIEEYPIDPDVPLIKREQARSAILFGPPGTGKTTVVEALAAAIGWEFIEVHASSFLSRGMDHVPARADEIFARLMELDHCVVLFDEIDELLRERFEKETDPFGRFLTTIMLPKVAELWKQRRVLFFVATNDIAHADRAIKRSQRFDAAIFMPPPSLQVKVERLGQAMGGAKAPPRVGLSDVEEALTKSAEQNPLGFFALLRYDQIDELAAKLRSTGRSKKDLEEALRDMGAALQSADWHNWEQDGQSADPFKAFLAQRQEERRDYRVVRVMWVDADVSTPPGPEFALHSNAAGGSYLILLPSTARPPDMITVEGAEAHPDGLLRYFRT